MRMFFWVLTIIGSVIGGFFMVDALLVSTSAPQQGAAAAVAVGFAVLPYVFARACDQIAAIQREPKPVLVGEATPITVADGELARLTRESSAAATK